MKKSPKLPAACAALWLCACSPGPSNDDVSDTTDPQPVQTSIGGTLSVLPDLDRISLSEVEPNDTLDDLTTVGEATPGGRIEVFGSLTADDPVDMVRVTAASALQVTVVLSFQFDPDNTDFGVGVYDLQNDACGIGALDVPLSACFDGDNNPESGTVDLDGDFVVVVHAVRGAGNYVLGLEFTDSTTSAGLNAAPFRPGEVLIQFASDVPPAQCRAIAARCGVEPLRSAPCGVWLTRVLPAVGSQTTRMWRAIGALRREHAVRFAEPNYVYQTTAVPNDEFYELQWHYDLINLPEAWDRTVGAEDIIVAVVDTGVILDHPDLGERLVDGYDFISDPDSARDGDGPDPDPTDAGDLAGGPGQSSYHGLHVAGTIGAVTDNATGVAGISWAGRVMPVRALGVNGGSSFDIGEAVRFAAGLENISGSVPAIPARVINLSIAGAPGGSPSQIMSIAIADASAAGAILVASAGNNGSSLPTYPAAFQDVLAISACDAQLELASYSNFGAYIDLAAPGGELGADVNGDGFGDGVLSLSVIETAGEIEFALSLQQGTSMAAPHVSGTIALMLAVNPALDANQVLEILANTARDAGESGEDLQFGAGVIDAAQAVNEAASRAGEPAPTDPLLSLSITALDFGSAQTTLTASVSNSGGGVLDIVDISSVEWIGSDWLSAAGSDPSQSTTVGTVSVAVDRTDLAEGRYRGRIEVSSQDGQQAFIDVSMTVGDALQIDEDVFVVAVDAATRQSVAQAVTRAADGFTYEILDLPPGTYKVYAGTDRDADDLICDLGELCGAQPSAIRATELTVEEGDTLVGVDFAVGELVFQSAAMPLEKWFPIALPFGRSGTPAVRPSLPLPAPQPADD